MAINASNQPALEKIKGEIEEIVNNIVRKKLEPKLALQTMVLQQRQKQAYNHNATASFRVHGLPANIKENEKRKKTTSK